MVSMVSIVGLLALWRTDSVASFQPNPHVMVRRPMPTSMVPVVTPQRTTTILLVATTTTTTILDEYDSHQQVSQDALESSQQQRSFRRRNVSPALSFPQKTLHNTPTSLSSMDFLELPRHSNTLETTTSSWTSSLEVSCGRLAMVMAVMLLFNECVTGQSFADQLLLYGKGVWEWFSL